MAKIPFDDDNNNQKFIFLDKTHFEDAEIENEDESSTIRESSSQQVFRMAGEKYSIAVRIIFLLITLFLVLIAAIMFFFVAIFYLINLVTFFKLKQFWAKTQKVWLYLRIMTVLALGMTVAIVNPGFGMGIITLYVSMIGEKYQKDRVWRMMRDKFHQ